MPVATRSKERLPGESKEDIDDRVMRLDSKVDRLQRYQIEPMWGEEISSDSEDDEEDGPPTGTSWLKQVFWTIVITCTFPFWLLDMSLRGIGKTTYKSWPLGSYSKRESLVKVFFNCATIAIILYSVSVWAARYQEISLMNGIIRLPMSAQKCFDSVTQTASLLDCFEAFLNAIMACVLVVSLFSFHKIWFRVCISFIIVTTYLWKMHEAYQLKVANAVEITSIDPTFVFINEPLTLAIDGKNLRDEGWVIWKSIWNCENGDVDECGFETDPMQLNGGMVTVNFSKLDEYFPCYAETVPITFTCYPSVILRIKDKKSIPGWSLKQKEEL